MNQMLLIIFNPIRLTILPGGFNKKFNRDRGCISLGLSGSGSVIHDQWNNGASKELMNPLWSRIRQFL